MEKIMSVPSLSPNNLATTTKTNNPQLVIDQDDLDKLSTQLKLLKIDDLTINKILKKYKPIKKEVKSEPQEYQVLNPQRQQQPFVGYDGLLEFAISQVKNCGYEHVLPLALIGNKKNSRELTTAVNLFNINSSTNKNLKKMNNQELKLKMLIEKYKSDNKKFLFLSSLSRKNIINEENALNIIREVADKTDYKGVFGDLVNDRNDRQARRPTPYPLPRRRGSTGEPPRRGSTIDLTNENEEPENDIG